MTYTRKLILFTSLMGMAIQTSMARPSGVSIPAGSNLIERLKLDDESSNCWESLIELQACTGEVILFFLNGETYLGPSCCQAIRIIGQHCWPAMFGSVGFTTEEVDVLQGYCLEEAGAGHVPPSPSSSTRPSPLPPSLSPSSSPPSVQPIKVVLPMNLVP